MLSKVSSSNVNKGYASQTKVPSPSFKMRVNYKEIEQAVENLVREVDDVYEEVGQRHLNTILNDAKNDKLFDATRGLVKGGYFQEIEDYLSFIPIGRLSKKNNLIVHALLQRLTDLGSGNKLVQGFTEKLSKNSEIPYDVKEMFTTRLSAQA